MSVSVPFFWQSPVDFYSSIHNYGVGCMRARVAVATVDGKTYFLVVSELKRRGIPFLSLIPGESIPAETKTVITTQAEKTFVSHSRILFWEGTTDPEILGNEVVKILLGKENYETMLIGVDPGEVLGIVAIADGQVIDSENCFSVRETLNKIESILKTVDPSTTSVTVKIGRGVPIYRILLRTLDQKLPPWVLLEIVEEAGTNGHTKEGRNRRSLRHIISATLIARRPGYVYQRRKLVEPNP